jgi:glucuronokinase
VHRANVPARAGLAGNPSDAYGGAAVAVPVPALAATVEVVDAAALRVVGAPDGERLIRAGVTRLARRAAREDDTFEVRWSTTIPREVGLAGSSAIVIATMQALCARWELVVPPLELAHLALATEVEDLGIAAGLMDRAVQAFGAPVLVDGNGARALAVSQPPTLVVAWRSAAAASSHTVHGPLRERFQAGEPAVIDAIDRLAALGREAASAMEQGEHAVLTDCVRATWRERCGLGIVGPETAAMVEALDAVDVAATSAGSGGAVVGVLPPDADVATVEHALEQCGRDSAPADGALSRPQWVVL